MEYRDYNDFELLSYIKESNEDANNIIFNKYKPIINSLAKKHFKRAKGIEFNDLVQEGMVGLSYAINSFNEKKDVLFYTYAVTCIERKIISAIIKTNTLKNKALNDSLSYENTDEYNFDYVLMDNKVNPERLLIEFERQEELKKIIEDNLTDYEKKILELKMSGLNYNEIAQTMNTDKKSVDNAIQRLRNKIKNNM